MTQILNLTGSPRDKAARADDGETTEALSRLQEMPHETTVGTPLGEEPGGATAEANESPMHADDGAAGDGLASLEALLPAAAMMPVIDESQSSSDMSPIENATDPLETPSADDEAVPQTGHSATEAALRHQETLQRIRDEVQVEVAAAVEVALRDKSSRHAEELVRVQAALDAQHAERLRHVGDSVLASLETLTARMVQTAA